MDDKKDLEERFREAASIGDQETLGRLLQEGVDINSQNHMNGWTALHWASKRGHAPLVQFLLAKGADKSVTTDKGEHAGQLTDRLDIHTLLGGAPDKVTSNSTALPITPNYIQHPPFPHGRGSAKTKSNRDLHASINHHMTRNHQSGTMIAANLNPDELVLKVRIANAQDTDYIEIELDRLQLTFANLIHTCCQELQVESSSVLKISKLPNTILRKDKDVMRLVDFQELELVIQRKSTVGNYQVPALQLIY
ncbi:ankyrin repeat domain-containing protein 40-like [Amphiura filiformis]|uniref:ankyrin repeat domain-containing protein 40-like n=1 Tax=Amphiura filiformis TaxID=82378 RepID=UPI003B217096